MQSLSLPESTLTIWPFILPAFDRQQRKWKRLVRLGREREGERRQTLDRKGVVADISRDNNILDKGSRLILLSLPLVGSGGTHTQTVPSSKLKLIIVKGKQY